MQHLGKLLLVPAAAALAYVAYRAQDPDYAAPIVPARAEVVPHAVSAEIPAGMAVRTIRVDGMCCNGCAGKLHQVLAGVDGVEEAAVDFVTGTASAVVPADADPEPLVAALRFDKYTAELVE